MLRSLAGGTLYGETWGEGAPAVLSLHGWGRTHADFAPSLGPAAPGGPLSTLAPDLPGFGATPAPSETWGSVEYAQAVARLLEEVPASGPGPGLVVVGHSLGGRIAVHLAAARPELVDALVLTGAPLVRRTGASRPPPVAYRLARALHRARLVSDTAMERARQRHGSADYRAAQGVMRDVLVRLVNERYDDALSALACPVELVWGDDDTDVPVETARAIMAAVPQARLTLCPGAGHLVPLTAPAELRAAVERASARAT
ncbi:MAG TPA: alpha/beta hydrolase [Acidimicrobiales bacterium]